MEKYISMDELPIAEDGKFWGCFSYTYSEEILEKLKEVSNDAIVVIGPESKFNQNGLITSKKSYLIFKQYPKSILNKEKFIHVPGIRGYCYFPSFSKSAII